jgi:hypothetical protein
MSVPRKLKMKNQIKTNFLAVGSEYKSFKNNKFYIHKVDSFSITSMGLQKYSG